MQQNEGADLQGLEAQVQLLQRQLEECYQAKESEKLASVRELLASLSHDVRTPLTSIQNGLFLLSRLTDESKRAHYLDIIQMQVQHLEKLFFDVYNITRIDTEVTTYDFRRAFLENILKTMVSDHTPAAADKEQTLILEMQKALPRILADEPKLGHALDRILENAIQYSPAGSSIRIRAYADQNDAVIEITDHGIGISAKALPRIFDAFFREDEARNLRSGRTGLGLTIASKIIQSHKGRIEVESQQGLGSTFRVYIPALVMKNNQI